jgi:hypothetical protein
MRMLVACLLGMISMLVRASARSTSSFEVRLTSDVADVDVDFGLVVNHANTLEREPTLVPPPGNYSRGSLIVAAFPSLDPELPGTYEVYVTNSTGNIPLAQKPKRAAERHTLGGDSGGMCLYRWITADFRTYQRAPACCGCVATVSATSRRSRATTRRGRTT